MRLRVCGSKGLKGSFACVLPFSGGQSATDTDVDGVDELNDAFPISPAEFIDSDSDGVGDNRDALPFDSSRQYLDLRAAIDLNCF